MALKLSFIIPAYNEEKRVANSLRRIHSYFNTVNYKYEVILSDDGSNDGTLEIVNGFLKDWPQLKLVKNKHKGKAPTQIAGYKESSGEYVIFCDTDLSVDVTETPKLLNWLENQNFDIAIATREGVGASRINEPYIRHLMGRVFNTIVQILLLSGINDTQCGFKAFKRDVLDKILSKMVLYGNKNEEITHAKVSAYDVELLYVAKKFGFKIKEVPVTWVYGAKSKVHNINDSYYNLKDVLTMKWYSLTGKYKIKKRA